jgi:outer membrane lipoprotein-sorting protein
MTKKRLIFKIFVWLFFLIPCPLLSAEKGDENQLLSIVQKMESQFKALEDYTCEVDQIFYRNGVEDQRCQFKLYFKGNRRRVDFSHPYPALTLFYTEGAKVLTLLPFRSVPFIKFRFSIDNPTVKTISGQRIDQTDIGYFIKFLSKNIQGITEGESEFYEDGDQIRFLLRAMDYITGKQPEKYRIFISKKNWLPVGIERYSLGGSPIEIINMRNYVLNAHLEEKFFIP